MKSKFVDMTSSSHFWRCRISLVKLSYWSQFHVNIMTGSGVMTISFIRDWPEIRKSEIPPSEFCPISGDWGKPGIPNLARMSLTKCYWMLQNARVTAFTVSELLRESQEVKLPLPTHRLGLKKQSFLKYILLFVKLWFHLGFIL